MSPRKRLRNLVHNLKDKASVIVASLSIKRHVSSIRVHVLRATTHNFSTPPSEARIAAILSAGRGSYILPRACINALMDRLHKTQNATVALKCLFTLHNIIAKGPLTLKDNLSYYPSHGGHNALNLSSFRDNADLEALELSTWVRWYAKVLEHVLTVSRVLGYYLSSSDGTEREHLGVSSGELLGEIHGLVDFAERVSHVPDTLHLQRNDLVYEVVRLVGEDYGRVQREILLRVEEIGKRMGRFDVGELRELVSCLKRLEESKGRLVLLFVNRKRNDAFWEVIGGVKSKGVVMMDEIEGKWMTVVTAKNESTRFTNPFLDPGQLVPVLPGGAWPGVTRNEFLLTVPTVG
ncbi:putative clathrin assembly protein At4g40080 [Abrus precatorius]|uniref:Clathrin assembly protein At4g40080 n=1 Tax=Abrus precatorius TaxID=3816 RepID=A0A8B8MLC1_ABRPR|nr:putative clathrin assembly protein At4g40080 [Abrus precatorius]